MLGRLTKWVCSFILLFLVLNGCAPVKTSAKLTDTRKVFAPERSAPDLKEESLQKPVRAKYPVRVMFVGDSMVEAVKSHSATLCEQKGFKCKFLFKRGLRTDAWSRNIFWGAELVMSIKSFKPDVIVLSSGTNDIYNNESPEEIYRDFVSLIELIRQVSQRYNHHSPIILIVSPPIPNDRNLNKVLENNFSYVEDVYVMDSKSLQLKLRDGIHPDVNSSKVWASKIVDLIDKSLLDSRRGG